ncbi:MAG TPA: MG2 domain-containing protein, partial [Ignavibacteriaceae bacterium]
RQNWLGKFSINLDKALNQRFQGIYIVNVRSNEERWVTDSKIISISDLGIIAKRSANQVTVFVNSISGAEPVEGVEVSVISSNNQVILSGKTNREGVLIFDNIKPQTEGFYGRLITVEKEGDFNFIDLNRTRIETSRFDIGGIYEYSTDYSTYTYSERNLYRPGEKVNLTTIVRSDKIKVVKDLPAGQADIPVIIKIITPTGKTFNEYKKNLNEEGSFELFFDLPDYAQTGEYVAEIYSGPNQLISSYRFSVEEFVPDKIRVMLKEDKKTAHPGDILSVDINSEFLFGAKASGLKYEAQFQYTHKNFISKNYPAYNFSNSSSANTNLPNKFRDGTLDQSGYAVIKDTITSAISSKGIVQANAYVSVFDLTGRTVNRSVSFDVYPQNYFVGISASGYYFATNDKLNFKFIAVDEKDKPLQNFKAKASLVRYEWQTVLKKDNSNRYYYASEYKEIKEWERNIEISGGPLDFTFTVSHSGKYELRVSKEGTNVYQAKTFYAYGWGGTTASSFEVDKEGRIEIVTDKEIYEPGEKAKLLFTTPFAGKMLVTLERNGLYFYKYVNVASRSSEVEIDLTDEYMPNVYVSATLFRKHNMIDASPFLVGHGYASIKVERKKNKLPVTISAPVKIKPNTKQEISIKTLPEKNIYITLAAVDEGILQIKNYETPDPYKHMYGKRTLRTESFDLYKLLLPEIVTMKSSVGGDGYEEEAKEISKRSNPVKSKRFKLVTFWSGIRKSDSDGIVKVNLSIHQFNGDIRLMAVAYSGSRFGSAEEHMKVADDIIIEPEIPRFLSTNDSLVSTVTLINTTSSNKNVNVVLKVEGPMQVSSGKDQSVTISPNSTA